MSHFIHKASIIIFIASLGLIVSCGSNKTIIPAGQSVSKDIKGLKSQAQKYFKAGKYKEAYDLYTQVKPTQEVLMYRGIAAHHIGKIDESLSDLISSYSHGNREDILFLYMGDNYRSQGKYEDAAKFYKSYLQYLDRGLEERYETVHKIKRCGFAKNYQYVDQLAFVENLGESVNSRYDELSPLQSPNNVEKYYFSSDRSSSTGGMRALDGTKDDIYGSYSADIYAVESRNGNWTSISSIDPVLNTAKDDIIQDFSRDGKILYYLKNSEGIGGDILTDTFRIDREELNFPKPMQSPIQVSLGDRDLRAFNDSTYIYSSKRQGGYGGYDIYILLKTQQGWSEPINLGPTVNSEFDDVTPFMTNNGSKLYFSSNRLESMGGFDVFSSDFGLETGQWNKAINLGLPINSPDNDLYFRLSKDGLTAIMSSDRIESFEGSYDLYMVYFKNLVQEQLLTLNTIPYLSFREKEFEKPITTSTDELVEVNINGDEPNVEEQEVMPKQDELVDYTGVSSREIVLSPLYYQSSENIMNPANLNQLKKVVETMKIFPETKIEIIGHAIKEGLPEFDLYFSIKRAEKAAEYLKQENISEDRIFLRGVGSTYPAVNPSSAIQSNKYNRRLDLRMIYPPQVPLRVIYERINIQDALKDDAIDKFKSSEKGLTYRIGLVTTKQMYKNDIIRKHDDVIIEKEFSVGDYQYTAGLYLTYADARKAKSILSRDDQFSNADIRVYIDGRIVAKSEIEKYLQRYPDLTNYQRYED